VSKAYKGKNFPTFDFVKNRKFLDQNLYKVSEQNKKKEISSNSNLKKKVTDKKSVKKSNNPKGSGENSIDILAA
jgi:hypothetical protein